MAATATGYAHVEVRSDGIPIIAGTRYKVAHLVQEQQAWGLHPQQLADGRPDLTLGQIYSALAYYADHQREIEQYIRETDQLAERLAADSPSVQLMERVRSLKRRRGKPRP